MCLQNWLSQGEVAFLDLPLTGAPMSRTTTTAWGFLSIFCESCVFDWSNFACDVHGALDFHFQTGAATYFEAKRGCLMRENCRGRLLFGLEESVLKVFRKTRLACSRRSKY